MGKISEQANHQKYIDGKNKPMKMFNIIREIQIKTVMRYHAIPTRMVLIKTCKY
jgi:hypothetical protein